jgi:hypothetical protein
MRAGPAGGVSRPAAPIDRRGSSALAADPIQQPIARAVPSGRTGQKGGAADTGGPTTPADRFTRTADLIQRTCARDLSLLDAKSPVHM